MVWREGFLFCPASATRQSGQWQSAPQPLPWPKCLMGSFHLCGQLPVRVAAESPAAVPVRAVAPIQAVVPVRYVEDLPAAAPVLVLSPMQALAGGQVEVRLGARTGRVTTPKGLRSGDHLRLRRGAADGSDLYLSVLIRPEDGLSVVGDDLFMTWAVERRLMADGGRVEIETPVGTRSAWITADMAAPVRVRLKDLGLPARGSRPAGHLFVTLEPSSDVPSAAEDLLVRFTRVWTQERLAA